MLGVLQLYPPALSEPSAYPLSHKVSFYNNAKGDHSEIIPAFPEEEEKKAPVAWVDEKIVSLLWDSSRLEEAEITSS